jgi:hypothetical protein
LLKHNFIMIFLCRATSNQNLSKIKIKLMLGLSIAGARSIVHRFSCNDK